MRNLKYIMLCITIILGTFSFAYAKEGDCGYEGGISSGQNLSTSKGTSQFEYQEVVFITGKPIVLKGQVEIKEKVTNDTITTTYKYELSDTNNNSLSRNLTLLTKLTKKDNNQVVRETEIYKTPSETIKIDDSEYTLDTYYNSKSSLMDSRPAADYFAGNINSTKIYNKTGDESVKINVTVNGEIYGYQQNWSNAEVQITEFYVESESSKDKWSGTATVKLSQTLNTRLKYIDNFLEEISFSGGYVQTQNVTSKLRYISKMPVFDINGISTDKISTKSSNLFIESFPKEKRLVVHDLASIRGHWAEEDINKLYSLEIFDESPTLFIPNQYISRAEFTKALAKTINSSFDGDASKSKSSSSTAASYEDVPKNNVYFKYIQLLTEKEVLSGYEDGKFHPDEPITRVQAIEAFVKVLGLQGISKDEYPVTVFRDHDKIPSWALRSVYSAYKIGFIKGDDGYLYPDKYLTKAETSALITRFIDYMRESISKSYSDKILDYELISKI